MSREISLKALDVNGVRINARLTDQKGPVTVLFIHGNCSSSLFWHETLKSLPARFNGVAPDLRSYGASEAAPIDATRGVRDFSDDVYRYAAAEGLVGNGRKVALVGHSVGGGVAMQFAIDHPDVVSALVLEDPVSPYGFGGTRDVNGTPCWDDFAGSGGGTANPEFVRLLAAGERGGDNAVAPRTVMNTCYFRPPFRVDEAREEAFVGSMLATRVGDDFYPGDLTPSPNWPGIAPGTRGMNNALSAKYLNVSALAQVEPRPPILWIRGTDDAIVGDACLFDLGTLGKLGLVPGWPGDDVYPSQPMITQTRAVLETYRARGGRYDELVLSECGHSPHLERPAAFLAALHNFLAGN